MKRQRTPEQERQKQENIAVCREERATKQDRKYGLVVKQILNRIKENNTRNSENKTFKKTRTAKVRQKQAKVELVIVEGRA